MANHGPTNMANHELTIMANQNNKKFGAKMQSREWVFSHRSGSGIRIFDAMIFEDTVVSKIMEDFNTKCCVVNNEEKLFPIETILGDFVFINEENKSKEIQGKNALSFTKFVLGGFWLGGVCLGGLS